MAVTDTPAMPENHSVVSSVRCFPSAVFAANSPAQLKQGDWLSEPEFLTVLEESWLAQYEDYIGRQQAREYLDSLIEQDTLFSHYEPLTIHAWKGEQIVGICALRPLAGIDLITMLEVDQRFRGCGIGTQLLDALCCASECLMAHVSIYQPRVRAFYAQSGFHCLQRAHVQHGNHLLEFDVMARRCVSPVA